MAYYAHSVSGRPEGEWEHLARHLAEVADGAGHRGRRFGAEPSRACRASARPRQIWS